MFGPFLHKAFTLHPGNRPVRFWFELSPLNFQITRAMSEHPMRIKDLPDSERPRERLIEHGAEALRSAELIAILLRTGMKGLSAIQVAEQLLQKFGTLDHLARASLGELRQTKGVGRVIHKDHAPVIHQDQLSFTVKERQVFTVNLNDKK